ncbi:MAG: selenocysteine-specific translation elongation factor [Thermodesulfobacteriota bacterium]
MREIVLGTAGHVDHGKTSLVRALTGIETDRLKEEKKRGITIELGFAFLDLDCGHRLGIVDVPGHEKFVKNMVAGVAGIDLVAFVIAADEGIMPQTREHFEICRLMGVDKGLIVITKKDMVDEEWLELVEEDVRDFCQDTFLAEAPLLHVSSQTGEGIAQVKEELDRLVAASDFSEAFGPFRLPVDRVFSMKGFGSVVTGTSMSGRLALGDEVEVFPRNLFGKVRGIQSHGAEAQMVEAGKRTAINISGVEKDQIARGDIIATPGCLAATYMLDVDFLYLASQEKPLKNRTRVRVHLGSAEVMGRLLLLDDETLRPGQEGAVQLLLEEEVGAWPGDRYVVRSYSPVATIGGGRVHAVSPRKRRRLRPENKEAYKVYRGGDPQELALLLLRQSGSQGLSQEELARVMGIFGKRLQKLLAGPISKGLVQVIDSERQLMVSREVVDGLAERLLALLAGYHEENPLQLGLGKEELKSQLFPGLSGKLFNGVLNGLVKGGKVAVEESKVRLADHKVVFQADEAKVRSDMLAFFADKGLTVPTVKEVLARFAELEPAFVKEMLAVLVRDGELAKINEDLYYPLPQLAKLEAQLVAFIQKEGEIDAPRFKGLTGLTRKFSIPLLEYFDKKKVTLRVGDKRVLRGGS